MEKRKLNEHVPLEMHMQWRVRFNKKYVRKKVFSLGPTFRTPEPMALS